ncbi:MAG: glutathione synthase [Cyanobacteria bacterium J06648_16]
MKLAFIIDPIEKLDPGHDTSIAIMEAAQTLGHEVWIADASGMGVVDGQAHAYLTSVMLKPVTLGDNRWLAEPDWFTLGETRWQSLGSMDAVFMRIDPPVTVPYLYATYILDYVGPQTRVVNSPAGIRAANEKMYALQFTEAIPPTIVSQDKAVIAAAVERWGGVAVLKPLGGKGGEGILFLESRDRNFNSMIEISTRQGQEPVMVQTYLPEAKDGDKRIILLNGEPLGAVNRIPTGREFRGNMAVGGRSAKTEITPRELEICSQLAPKLKQDGLTFVGIDVIGGYLTEVNVTSPTGIREVDRLDDVRLGESVVKWLAQSNS